MDFLFPCISKFAPCFLLYSPFMIYPQRWPCKKRLNKNYKDFQKIMTLILDKVDKSHLRWYDVCTYMREVKFTGISLHGQEDGCKEHWLRWCKTT